MRKAIVVTAVVLIIFLVLAWFVGTLLGLHGARLWILRGTLALLGIAGAAVFLWFRWKIEKERRPAPEGAATPGGGEDIDLLFREAEARLSAAQLQHSAHIGNLPAIVVVGESGSTKTSTVLHSGLEPELLAGNVYQDGNVAPTARANLWYAARAIVVEAGGKLLADQAQWTRLVRRLRPGRLAGVFGKKALASRVALVCVDAESFTRPGASEAMAASARNLRARLAEISQMLGIRLPTYVLFTRMDRVPFFAEYVRNLTNEEAAQVLGITLPLSAARRGGIYAEQETARLAGAFDRLFRSLAHARPELLARENDAARLPASYEFPREFRKLRAPVTQFLVEICRPSQLTVGPFLRGLYFTGVRPVVVNEVEAAPVARSAAEASRMAGATGVFQVGLRAQVQQAAPPVTRTRKVPQWVFLGHLFHDVLLADQIAMGASGASRRANVPRRVLLACAAMLCLIFAIGFVVSYFHNRALEAQVRDAARGISAVEAGGPNLPSVDALRRLETLRQSVETLAAYSREGPPLSYRWGLYTGNSLYPDVRRIYFGRFRQLLFGQTQTGLLETLRGLPATPGPEYGPTYDTLKAYLITTSNHDRSTRLFLAPALVSRWSAGRGVDPERLQLAQKQFEFYAEELKYENPYSSENDGFAVDKARKYLNQFAGFERVYQAMLADAGRSTQPVNFNKRFPGSAEVLVDTREVAGPFTKTGWDFMKKAIQDPERYFSGEQWVLGDQGAANIDRSKLAQQLRDRYNSDFIGQWRAFLKSASVARYTGVADAARKLNLLSGNQSPLLALFWLASQNTAVDDPKVAAVFQPVQAVVPPTTVDRYIAPPNQGYVNALISLQTGLDQIANQQGPAADAAASQTQANATQARVVTRQVAQAFRIDPDAHIENTVEKLMEDPITYAEALVRTLGPAELNAKGKALCAQFRPLMSKYPFNPNATAEASLAEVNAMFRKPDGALWTFYQANLQKLLPMQGGQFVAASAGGVNLNPAFVNFFKQAAAISDAWYAGGAQDPHFTYTLKPVPVEGIQTLGLRLDGQAMTYSGGAATPKQFAWQGSGTHEAHATVKFGGGPELAWSNNEGLWAVFQFFAKAERPAGAANTLEWIIRIGKDPVTLPNGKPLTVEYELDMGTAPAVFQKGYFSRMACVAEVAR